jgi:hypothetical protein
MVLLGWAERMPRDTANDRAREGDERHIEVMEDL